MITFENEQELMDWIKENVMDTADVTAYLEEHEHIIQDRAVRYAIEKYGRLPQAWKTKGKRWLCFKSDVDKAWNLNE